MGGELFILAGWVINAVILYLIVWRMAQTRRKFAFAATVSVALIMYLPWVLVSGSFALTFWTTLPLVACAVAIPALLAQRRKVLAALFCLPVLGAAFEFVFSPKLVPETPFYMTAPLIFPTLVYLVAPTIVAVAVIALLRLTIEPVKEV